MSESIMFKYEMPIITIAIINHFKSVKSTSKMPWIYYTYFINHILAYRCDIIVFFSHCIVVNHMKLYEDNLIVKKKKCYLSLSYSCRLCAPITLLFSLIVLADTHDVACQVFENCVFPKKHLLRMPCNTQIHQFQNTWQYLLGSLWICLYELLNVPKRKQYYKLYRRTCTEPVPEGRNPFVIHVKIINTYYNHYYLIRSSPS